jgi:checkpoint serine/threonine-protein kinase
VTINPKTGKSECVFSDLEAVYPEGADGNNVEFSFEELRARQRGWLNKDWSQKKVVEPAQKTAVIEHEATCHLILPDEPQGTENIVKPLEDSQLVQTIPLKGEVSKKQSRKEDKANRTRKITVTETRTETQTSKTFEFSALRQLTCVVQLNLDSPARPRPRKRKADATMTIHTKEAMEEVYDIFNQTLTRPTEPVVAEEIENEDDEDDYDDDDDDDGTSVGESTATSRISGNMSDYDDAESTSGDFTASSMARSATDADGSTRQSLDDESDDGEEYTSGAGDESLSIVHIGDALPLIQEAEIEELTPTSPQAKDTFDMEPPSMNTSMPYRMGKGVSSKLPFMTPIVEKTESSLGAMTSRTEAKMAAMKTPSREKYVKSNGDIEEDQHLSSPFEENTEHYERDEISIKIAPPALPQPTRSADQPLVLAKKTENVVVPTPIKGPIITDLQVNPMDEVVRQTILSCLHPPLSSYTGYHDHRPSVSAKAYDIKKYIKAIGKSKSVDISISAPEFSFTGSEHKYTLRRELGRGAFAPVYLVDTSSTTASERDTQEVMKMEEPPSPWEFFVLTQARRRLGVSRAADSVIKPHEMHLFADEGFLFEEFRSQGTLLDAVNASRAATEGNGVDELLAMFFAVELLRTVEALHSKGVIHGDLKPDNILLRLDSMEEPSWSPLYAVDGSDGWSSKGITLIDFGRGADMKTFGPNTQFVAEWKTSEADCVEMREMRPWTYQVDYHGVAGTIHSLLFGKYMEVTKADARGLPGVAGRKYAIREGLKRYWQTEIWNELFEVLLNSGIHLAEEDGGKLPIVNSMRRVRGQMEEWLVSQCEKGVGLKGLIRRMEGGLRERRR